MKAARSSHHWGGQWTLGTPLLLSPSELHKCNRHAPLVQWDKTSDWRNLHQRSWQMPHPIRHRAPLLCAVSHHNCDWRVLNSWWTGRPWKRWQGDPFKASSVERRILLTLSSKISNWLSLVMLWGSIQADWATARGCLKVAANSDWLGDETTCRCFCIQRRRLNRKHQVSPDDTGA